MRRYILIAALMTLCCKSAEFPTQPKDATLALGPAFYCGAVRIGKDLAVTAKHCIQDGLCGTATDRSGVTVQCEVESMSVTTDVGTVRLSPGSYADVIGVAEYREGVPLECTTHKPFPFSRRSVEAHREIDAPCLGNLCLPNTIRLEGYFIPGESGSGCFQEGKLVAVISVSAPAKKQAWATLVLN